MDKLKLYNMMPILLQNIAFNYEGWRIKKNRYGSYFWNKLNEYEERGKWSYQEIANYRDYKMRKIIEHSYLTVPYYKKMFDDLKVDYKKIKTLEDLKILPILDKQTVNDNFDDFISEPYKNQRLIMSHTSGTTGSGFKFYITQEALSEQWAVWWRFRRKLGIEFDTWCANFGSKVIVPVNQTKPPFWRINYPGKQVYFSAFHLNDEYLYSYFEEIRTRKIKWIHGFPSLITLLATFIIKNNLKFGYTIDFVTIGAENLLPYQEKIIEHAFGTKVYQHYGLAEGVANFSQNRDGEIFIDDDFAATEILHINGVDKVIGTNLTNYSMPLIRYDTKDIVTLEKDINGFRKITSIDGREEDYITLPNGTKVGKLDHAFKDTINFREVQLYQKSDFSIDVKIVKRNENVRNDEEISLKLLRESIGNEIIINYKYVEEIERTDGGKLRFVKSDIGK